MTDQRMAGGSFLDKHFLKAIDRFLQATDPENQLENNISDVFVSFIWPALSLVRDHADLFETHCQHNRKFYNRLFSIIDNPRQEVGVADVELLFTILYRVYSEVHFNIDVDGFPGVGADVERLLYKVRYGEIALEESLKKAMVYPDRYMPIDMLKEILRTPPYEKMAKFDQVYGDLSNKLDEVDGRADQVEKLKDALGKYKDAFNFVGLYDGFNSIAKEKLWSARGHVVVMLLLAAIMVSPFIVKAWLAVKSNGVARPLDIELLVLAGGFELLMLYFFKVVLHSYRSLKGQLAQLDLRRTLCQFVQSYAEYALTFRKDSPQLLERFEQLIFSGIVVNEDNIPSTLDGLEHVARVLDKLKPK